MKAIKTISIATMLTTMLFAACKKQTETQPQGATSTPFEYKTLSAEKTTVTIGKTTKISATATGNGLTYTWSLNGTGDLIGSGYQITYSPCCTGQNRITCVVKDSGGNQVSKSVIITVQ